VLRGAALTLKAAAARGLIPAADAAPAVDPMMSLGPGDVQRQVCDDQMEPRCDAEGCSCAPDAVKTSASKAEDKVANAKQTTQAAIAALGFKLHTDHASTPAES